MPSQTYTTYQAAERLGVSVRRIQALIATGLLDANKVGRDWLISGEEVERFEKTERQSGRPNRARTKVERPFLDRPSATYQMVVDTIRTLIELDGLEAAYRAFAEAAWQNVQESVMSGYKPKGLSHTCVHRLLGRKRCPDTYEHPCDSPDFPGQDHVSEWTQNGKTTKIISQPYQLSFETLKHLVEYCDDRGLRADISAESWHFPGKTLRVDFTQNGREKEVAQVTER